MFVEVSAAGRGIAEADDLRRLEVRAGAIDGAALAAALDGLGTVADDGDHVWLGIDALRSEAAATIDGDRETWAAEYDAMIAYAADHGWVTDDGTAVRAHLAR